MTRLPTYDPVVADLILLNGPPASGKSTIAQRYVESQPLALNLDLDVIRGLLGRWADEPLAAGLMARSFGLKMATQHLESGHNVIVPQFLGRLEFIGELAGVAAGSQARFVEIALWVDRAAAISAFVERSASPTTQAHIDAAELVKRSPRPDPVGAMYDEFVAVIGDRPRTVRIDVIRNDIEATFNSFCEALT